MNHLNSLGLAVSILFILPSCNGGSPTREHRLPKVAVKTVTVKQGYSEKKLTLNGKTLYLNKTTVISPISGYVIKMNVNYGDQVKKEETLFEIQTRESKTLRNTDALPAGAGILKIKSSLAGIVGKLTINATGSYITQGSALCTIVGTSNVLVQVNVPFEHHSQLKAGTKCTLLLPDQTSISGIVVRILPFMDPVSQTQKVLILPASNQPLPENLHLMVQFITNRHQSLLLPRNAIMTNEEQSKFWVMKIKNDSVAVKVPIQKGIENDSMTEIASPRVKPTDTIISEGAYGLANGSIVKITK